MRCLIIDDDESPRMLMARLILRTGHACMAVDGPKAALSAMTAERFDIAIVDMEMPDGGGVPMIGNLKQIDPQMRVLVVSGYDDRRHVMAALDAGADGYLVKDEVPEALGPSLQSVRAGHTPLSPRVAAIMVRQLRKERPVASGAGPVTVAKLRPPSSGR
jgi:DNA-binding NarL/FixJ family response regulator